MEAMGTTAEVLWSHVHREDLCPGSETLEAWREVRWIRARVRERAIPILPVVGYRDSLVLHDVHHVLTGYSTRLGGELELAAWELASGGCGRHVLFWIDRSLALLLGLAFLPRRTIRAWRRGRGCRNLYRTPGGVDELLATDFEELARRVGR